MVWKFDCNSPSERENMLDYLRHWCEIYIKAPPALKVHPAASHRNHAWPNCVKSILTHPSPMMASLDHGLMVTAPILYLDWWELALYHQDYISALSTSQRLLMLSGVLGPPLPFPTPINIWQSQTNARGAERSTNQAETKWFVGNIYPKGGVALKISIIPEEDPEKGRDGGCLVSKCHENVNAVTVALKGLF